MASIKRIIHSILWPYRLQTDDMDLLRAQFSEFFHQIPLLYFILAGNSAAVAVASWHMGPPVLTQVVPAILCLICAWRGTWWWWKCRLSDFEDHHIRRQMRSTAILAGVIAAAVVIWILSLFPYANAEQRGYLAFFVALTQIACVFCLMPVRSAALSVASIGILPVTIYFMIASGGRMWVQALNLGFVGIGMIIVLNRYNRSFADLIRSQRDLRVRQAEAERLGEENRRSALTDALSGLPNRRALIVRLEEIHARATITPATVAVLFVDLDGFKQINDTFGHELGDDLIRHLSKEFDRLLPRDAMLVRMGGDEFAILLESARATEVATKIARRIQTRLTLPIGISGHEFQVGASIGIAGCPEAQFDTYELLRRADTAMYRVKSEGGCGTMVYTAAMDEGRQWRKRVEGEIRAGLERNEFDVHYQPLVDATTGAVVAVEALCRWPGRPDGPLGPEEFIPVAETCGLIHPLGLFVLRRACTDLAGYPGLKLNVNVSPAQFRHPEFEREAARIMRTTGFPPQRLQIEITEGYLIDNPDRANRAIAAFSKMGVRVALDDFGSGFASIGYLRNYGFSGIKIDKSLARGLGDDPKASMLISGMVHLANGLDMQVTAEGVETERQATLLRLAGCHQLQGFLFGAPAPLDALDLSMMQPALLRA